MNDEFAAAMCRATALTRALDLDAATCVIQEALRTQTAGSGTDRRQFDIVPPPPRRKSKVRLIDPGADIVDAAPEPDAPPAPRQATENAGTDAAVKRPPSRLRRPLGEVVRLLRRGRQGLGAFDPLPGIDRTPRRAPSRPLPDGAQFLTRSFSCAAGTRSYKLYIPASTDRPSGLILMLHGCKQDPDDFAAGTNMNALAETHGLLVAYPSQTGTANASACWNWFNPADQTRGAGEPAILAGITTLLAEEFGLERRQVFAAGLSAGGAMAAVMGETYPDLYAAVGIHSGLAYGSAQDVASAFAAMRGEPYPLPQKAPRGRGGATPFVRAIVFQGSMDAIVHPSNGEHIVRSARRTLATDRVEERSRGTDGRSWSRTVTMGADGHPAVEFWLIDGAGHAWSGGARDGSYTDPIGPDASMEMIRFFLKQTKASDG